MTTANRFFFKKEYLKYLMDDVMMMWMTIIRMLMMVTMTMHVQICTCVLVCMCACVHVHVYVPSSLPIIYAVSSFWYWRIHIIHSMHAIFDKYR